MTQPYDFSQASKAAAAASRAQHAAEEAMKDAARAYARAEESYRVKLAETILQVHADGAAWTVAGDLARGDKHVAALRRERDIAEGVRDAMHQAAWRRAADRKDTQRFIDWSARIDLRIDNPEPNWDQVPVVGGRHA